MKNVFDNARVYGDAQVSGDAEIYGNARVFGNALVYGNAQVSDNARVYGNAQVFGNAWVSGNALVYGDAQVSGNALVYGDAQVSGNAKVYGNAEIYGDADIQSNNDWFSFINNGETLTGYRSRNPIGYELNVNGKSIDINTLSDGFDIVVRNLISKFTPFENKEKTELKSVIADLEKQLEEAKNRFKEI